MGPPSAVATPDALHRELARERAQSARRVNLLRFSGVSAFFLLFLVLGGLLKHPAWTGNLHYFAVYWFDVRQLRHLVRASVERERSPRP